ncbi:CHASE2 domain-containing protein [Nevskia soli]|uniref:CHASE2 domain-containing protein n=1 Tax=Nevskia soli TaxID=418856 RepID=UPI0004A6B02C|nr:adenylate/guanylate cyclase domain-containing protein [Nevskia soli]
MGARIAVALALVLLEIASFAWLGQPEHRVQDWLLSLHAQRRVADADIVLVNIDERSIAAMNPEFGPYEWPRSVYAEFIEKLGRQHPAAIIFDQFFADPQREHPDQDAYFIDTVVAAPNVYVGMARLDGVDETQGLALATYGERLGFERGPAADPAARLPLLLPFQRIAETGRIGLINFLPDDDGVGRRYLARLSHHGWRIPSLPLRVARDLGWPLPADSDIEINWRGLPQSRASVSFSDVFLDLDRQHPQRPPDEFHGKVLIIGATAIGRNDLHPTPLAQQQTGPEILAAALETIKHGDALLRPPLWFGVLIGLLPLFLLGLAYLRGVGLFPLGLALVIFSPLSLLFAYGALQEGWLVRVVAPLASLWVAYLALALREYLRERHKRDHAVRIFSRFVNPHVVKTLVAEQSGLLQQGAQSQQITVLFSDIRGFTTFSESRTPEQVVSLLNRYFSRQVAIVFKHGGTVDKFIGDAIMAFWGAPLPDQRQAERAVQAALEMARVAVEFAREVATEGVEFDVGIGIHSGPAVVGFIGSENKTDYTAIGDTVNLASRIEGLTKGVARVLVSEQTRQACGSVVDFIDRGDFKAKGREQPVRLFEPVPGSVVPKRAD